METRSAKKKKLQNHAPKKGPITTTDHRFEDRISDLPDHILHHIFIFLPIRSIAQTCVLSKRWKSIWYSFPDLDFTTVNLPANTSGTVVSSKTRKKDPSCFSNNASKFIDLILSLLEKHADIRVLKFRAFMSFSRLISLIRHAVKHNVQELDIEVSTCDYFNFPRSVIYSKNLRSLRLKSWHPGFRLAPFEIMKEGFRALSTLSLSRAVLHDQPSIVNLFTFSSFPCLKKLHFEACFGLKHLRIECPVLEDFCLESCFQLEHLEICVQKLERLRVSSCFDAYSVVSRVKIDAPMLKSMMWSYNAVTQECILSNLNFLNEAFIGFFLLYDGLSVAKTQSIMNLLYGVSHCHSLTLESQCIEILSTSSRIAGIISFQKLKSLELTTGFNKHNNPGLASLFRNSPTIHTIVITIIGGHNIAERPKWNKDLWESPSSGEERYWESQTQSLKSFLQHLKVLKIHGFTECENEISLLKFLLKHGKVLQQVFLCTNLSKPKDTLLRDKIKSQIMGFSRASSNANIFFK